MELGWVGGWVGGRRQGEGGADGMVSGDEERLSAPLCLMGTRGGGMVLPGDRPLLGKGRAVQYGPGTR
jgi:hypothetical protein